MKKAVFILLFVLLSVQVLHATVMKEGTLISVRLTENVNGNIDQPGETIYFQVLNDVHVSGDLVLRKGAFIKGKVKDAVGRKSLGKGGKLKIVPRSYSTEDNEIILFVQDELSAEGRKRTGATVAHVIAWGPLGLFAKGRAAFILLDTEYDLEVAKDVDLKPLQALAPKEKNPPVTDERHWSVRFERYRKKINYRKGKNQKDFVLKIKSLGQNQGILDASSVRIVQILGHDLPFVLEPTSLVHDVTENGYLATFSFLDILKFIHPGDSDFVIEIGGQNPEEYSAHLITKWKLK